MAEQYKFSLNEKCPKAEISITVKEVIFANRTIFI